MRDGCEFEEVGVVFQDVVKGCEHILFGEFRPDDPAYFMETGRDGQFDFLHKDILTLLL